MTKYMMSGEKGLQNNSKGFTLIELMIAVVIGSVVLYGIYYAYSNQHELYSTQEQVAGMQQNLRAAMYFMERDLRMAGLEVPKADGTKSGLFGVSDIRYRDLNDNTVAPGNNAVNFSAIEFLSDTNNNHGVDADEISTYSVFDEPPADGNLDLAWNQTPAAGGRQAVAANIEALTFAYAYDDDGDGALDFFDNDGDGVLEPGDGDYVVWAIDSDNDNALDFDLDTDQDAQLGWADMDENGDGLIDGIDDQNNDGDADVGDFLAAGGTSPLPGGGTVPLTSIRAVRIWLLARTDRAGEGEYVDVAGINANPPHFLGDRAIVPTLDPNNPPRFPDDFRRRVLTTIIHLRN